MSKSNNYRRKVKEKPPCLFSVAGTGLPSRAEIEAGAGGGFSHSLGERERAANPAGPSLGYGLEVIPFPKNHQSKSLTKKCWPVAVGNAADFSPTDKRVIPTRPRAVPSPWGRGLG